MCNEQGSITELTEINALIDRKECCFKAYITGLGTKDLILGYPWLSENNPDIDWTKKEFHWRNTDQIFPLLAKSAYSPMAINEIVLERTSINELNSEIEPIYLNNLDQYAVWLFEDTLLQNKDDLTIEELQLYLEDVDLDEFSIENKLALINLSPLDINAKITTSTQLSQNQSKQKQVELPKKFKKFTDLFDPKKSEQFPPSRPYDHKIELKESFKPELGKTYPLSQKETQELQTFLDDNLAKGYIQPSESPMASSFFVGKKDG